MRKVVVYTLVSVDGVAQDPETFLFDFDKTMEANLAEVIGTQDVVLLGRRMYDEWSSHWPKSDAALVGSIESVRTTCGGCAAIAASASSPLAASSTLKWKWTRYLAHACLAAA